MLIIFAKIRSQNNEDISTGVNNLNSKLTDLEGNLKDDFSRNRTELSRSLGESREEQRGNIRELNSRYYDLAGNLDNKVTNLTSKIENQISSFRSDINKNSSESRVELGNSLEIFRKNIAELSGTVEKKLEELQKGNSEKLDKIRETVDEKLNATLQKRLGEAFNFIGERLETVHKGLGEMKDLAANVGDLKKVFTNVKSRGMIGEFKLDAIISDILYHGQYERNVKIDPNSQKIVEYLLK